MRKGFQVTAGLIMLMVLWQAGTIAFGWFTTLNEVEAGSAFSSIEDDPNAGYALHQLGGELVTPLLGLVLFALSFRAGFPGAVRLGGMTLGAIVLQIVLAFAGTSLPVVGALHGVNAFVVFGLALMCLRRAKPAGGDRTAPEARPAA